MYEDVTDAKQACDKLNGFNFQSRYLVGKSMPNAPWRLSTSPEIGEGDEKSSDGLQGDDVLLITSS